MSGVDVVEAHAPLVAARRAVSGAPDKPQAIQDEALRLAPYIARREITRGEAAAYLIDVATVYGRCAIERKREDAERCASTALDGQMGLLRSICSRACKRGGKRAFLASWGTENHQVMNDRSSGRCLASQKAVVLPFPLARRIGLVKKLASQMLERSPSEAEQHLALELSRHRRLIAGKGFAEPAIKRAAPNIRDGRSCGAVECCFKPRWSRVSRRRKGDQNKDARHVRLYHRMMRTKAWRSLSAVARATYVEVAARYSGTNNGRIPYSVREAAKALHIGKSTAAKAFEILQERGFVAIAKRGGFNRKDRHATEWRLTEFANDIDGQFMMPTREYERWPEIPKHGPCWRTDDT